MNQYSHPPRPIHMPDNSSPEDKDKRNGKPAIIAKHLNYVLPYRPHFLTPPVPPISTSLAPALLVPLSLYPLPPLAL